MSAYSNVSDRIYSYLTSTFGEDAAKNYSDFIDENPAKYIRVNERRIKRETLATRLFNIYGIKTEDIPYPSNALKVIDGFDFAGSTLEIAFGFYYMQALTSMLPPLVLNPTSTDVVLDLCSAPGSKTTQIAEMMDNKGILIVNELEIDRIKALVFNLDKMNFLNYGVLNSRGEILSKYYNSYFDKILVDAPCSGLGIIQKKNEVGKWWSIERVNNLVEIQNKLLVSAIKMLKVGGELVYSTCSLTPEENELIISRILYKYPVDVEAVDIPVKHHKGLTEYLGVQLDYRLNKAIRIFPWEVDSDGFFLIKLKKTGETNATEQIKWKKHFVMTMHNHDDNVFKEKLKALADEFGIETEVFSNYKFILKRNDVYFTSKEWSDANLGLFHRVGSKFGIIDKNGNIVLHSFAAQILQDHISKNIYDIQNLDELRLYLMGALINHVRLPTGQYVVRFNDFVLGTGVVIKGGLKSRYPRSSRTQTIRIKGQKVQ
ncbi:MAG: RsmB/NOP family class I SAM-dependent RNA methyltransferase [Ignavibacteriaceae bacterium]|nr:RsmB/NOP family class I SAM-dependent RNA methyltransferase [Ignavibacteriaceae bacterium]